MALNIITAEQSIATEFTMDAVEQLLDDCVRHPDAKIHFKKSDMILASTLMTHTLVHPEQKLEPQDTSSKDGYNKTNNQ